MPRHLVMMVGACEEMERSVDLGLGLALGLAVVELPVDDGLHGGRIQLAAGPAVAAVVAVAVRGLELRGLREIERLGRDFVGPVLDLHRKTIAFEAFPDHDVLLEATMADGEEALRAGVVGENDVHVVVTFELPDLVPVVVGAQFPYRLSLVEVFVHCQRKAVQRSYDGHVVLDGPLVPFHHQDAEQDVVVRLFAGLDQAAKLDEQSASDHFLFEGSVHSNPPN
jgi:hypothetical protein